jgi:hypothetical protein
MPKLLFLLFLTIFQIPDYTIDLGKNYDRQKQVKAQGYIETFTIKDEVGRAQFIISITKVEISKEQPLPNVYEADYKKTILSKCDCVISSAQVKQFRHFKAQEFRIIRNGKGSCVYSTIKGNNLFSITYSALSNKNTEDKFSDFEKIMNSIKFI